MYAKTDDGDLAADGIEGDIELKTSDGDVDVGVLRGPTISLKTSDGDVTVDEIEGGVRRRPVG